MSTAASLALLLALFLVVGNWVLESCQAAATRHRTGRWSR